jgi:hypothetical protein
VRETGIIRRFGRLTSGPSPGATKLGAVVNIVSVVVPPTGTDAGLNEQVLSLGSPAHVAAAKLIGVLNPLLPLTVTIVVPVEPGAGTVIIAGAKVRLKSGPGVTWTTMFEVPDCV